jgi:hypothetical protein
LVGRNGFSPYILSRLARFFFIARNVQKLCEGNRIPGVSKLGYMWLIPKDAEKPVDGRKKENREIEK